MRTAYVLYLPYSSALLRVRIVKTIELQRFLSNPKSNRRSPHASRESLTGPKVEHIQGELFRETLKIERVLIRDQEI